MIQTHTQADREAVERELTFISETRLPPNPICAGEMRRLVFRHPECGLPIVCDTSVSIAGAKKMVARKVLKFQGRY